MDLRYQLSISELRELRTNNNQWIDLKGQSNAMSFTLAVVKSVMVDHKKL